MNETPQADSAPQTSLEQARDADAAQTYPRTVSSESVWRGRIFDVMVDHIVLEPGASSQRRDYIAHPGGVGIVVLRDGDRGVETLLIRQYRQAVRQRIWEVPAGLHDVADEPLLATAQRELLEEADLKAREWKTLLDLYTSPGCSNEHLRIYLARGVVPAESTYVRSGEEATMELRWVALDEAVRMIFAGEIRNPSAISGLLAAATHLANPELPLRDAV